MKQIRLNSGLIALIDDCDFVELSKYRWVANQKPHTSYAQCNFRKPDGSWSTMSMHRMILGEACEGFFVDHIDGNGLNNCRANLRVCGSAENQRNSKKRRQTKSGFKGVFRPGRCKRFQAAIRLSPKQLIVIGYFDKPEDAARAYDKAAKQHFGEFARLNFPEPQPA